MAQSSIAQDPSLRRGAHWGRPLPTGTSVAFLVAVVAIVLVAVLSYIAHESSSDSARRVTHTLQVMEQLQAILSTLQDAETGQRGFVLTGDEDYLEPYNNAKVALPGEFKSARPLIAGNLEQQRRLDALEQLAAEKMQELAETVANRRAGDSAGALAIVRSDRGKKTMELIRPTIADMQRDERSMLAARQKEWLNAASVSDGSAGLAAIHRSGGVTIVQEPASAQVPLMVLSALKRSPADFVLPLDEIADLLRTLASTDAVAPLIGPRGG
jgi:CHASE3 domain sensor protein